MLVDHITRYSAQISVQRLLWLLAKRKNEGSHGLGLRTIQTILAFHGGWRQGMTTEEIGRYCTPVLVFEVVDASEQLRAVQHG